MRRRRYFVIFSLALLFFTASALRSQPPASEPSVAEPAAPELTAGPVEVAITIEVNKIYQIDTVDETYAIDGYLIGRWHDERLAFEPRAGQRDRIVYGDQALPQELGIRIWWPEFEFINVIDGRDISHRRIVVEKSGHVLYDERFFATFASDMDFRKFPFDTQTFKVIIESYSYDSSQLVFVEPQAVINDDTRKNTTLWEIESYEASIAREEYPDEPEEEFYSRYVLEVTARREPGYFIWQFFLPLFLIVASSWTIFWIPSFGHQLTTAFTLMLTVVAFNFYTSSLLPELPYDTFIQAVVTSGYLAIFLAIVAILIGHQAEQRGDAELTRRFLGRCRWLFPLGHAVFIGFLTVYFLA